MTQAEALEVMLSGANVFLTGAPGSGKTYILNEFITQAEDDGKRVAITASTGIAASHIGGTTIHSWSGIGVRDNLTKEDLLWYKNNGRLVKRYVKTNVLVIDEVSMLHGFRLDMLDLLARELRKNDRPFGGIQVILVGDLFQLPPVNRDSSELHFVHHSAAWQQLQLRICYLTEQHRQSGEDALLPMLEAMRRNQITPTHLDLLRSRMLEPDADIVITRLYSHNVDVDAINQEHLEALTGETKRFKWHSSGDKFKVETLKRNILAPETLELKVGAEVMFVANNFSEGFVNGSQGKVIKFKGGDPIVKMSNGHIIRVEEHTWKTEEDDRVVAEVSQIPLRLAWAITIHKSQGMSLDAAQIDLSKAFTPGMGYVAISRVRGLSGLYLEGFNNMALTMHEEIYDFDRQLREASK